MSTARNFSAYNYDDMMHQEIVTKALKFEKNNAAQRYKSNWANRILALLMIVIVFGSMAFLLIRYAEINEIKYNNFELKKDIEQAGIKIKQIEDNLIDAIWDNQPDLPSTPIRVHTLKFAGESVDEKLSRLRSSMEKNNCELI